MERPSSGPEDATSSDYALQLSPIVPFWAALVVLAEYAVRRWRREG